MTPDPTTDYAARIKAGLVDCNVYAESADCPCCDAQDALASLEAELAEARGSAVSARKALDRWQSRHAEENAKRKRAETALREAADAIQEKKHSAGMSTAQCARDAEWDLEAYWRARGEGLAQAEAIVRSALAVSSASETETELPGDELPGAQAGTALQVPDTKGVAASASSRSVSASEPCGFVMDACMCDQPKGHAGLHSCAHRPSGLSASGETP